MTLHPLDAGDALWAAFLVIIVIAAFYVGKNKAHHFDSEDTPDARYELSEDDLNMPLISSMPSPPKPPPIPPVPIPPVSHEA